MNDLIRRKDALRPFIISWKGERIPETDIDNFPTTISFHDVKKILREVPSAEPDWTPCSKEPPKKNGWYICSLKDDRVCTKYWNGRNWIDNIRKNMFDLYNIYGKITGEKINLEDEDIYWDHLVEAWKELPEKYQPK